MQTIKIPKKKWRWASSRWKASASKALDNSFMGLTFGKEFEMGGLYYHPYWIGKVVASKDRPVFGAKEKVFFVVCNARDGTYLVLQNGMPPAKEEQSEEERIIPAKISLEKFEKEIVQEGIGLHIKRQFIFGLPENTHSEECWLMYIPVQKVGVRRKNRPESFQEFFVNVFSGRIERQA